MCKFVCIAHDMPDLLCQLNVLHSYTRNLNHVADHYESVKIENI